MRVRDAMTEHVLTITPGRSMREAAKFMTDHNVGAVVIIDPEEPGPGIITERDVVRSLGAGEDPDSEIVRDHLTSRATFADGDWDLEKAADAMAKGGFRHLVVIDDGELAGIISMRDLIQVWRPGGAGARSSPAA
jgi:CBS domain-containing protein